MLQISFRSKDVVLLSFFFVFQNDNKKEHLLETSVFKTSYFNLREAFIVVRVPFHNMSRYDKH